MWLMGFASEEPAKEPTPPAPSPESAPPEPPLEPEEHEPSVKDEMNVVVVMLLPWVITLVLHLGLLVLAIFVVWSTVQLVDEEEVIVPISRLSTTPGAPVQQTTSKRVSKQQSMTRRSLSQSRSKSQSTLATKANTQSSLIGVSGANAAKANAFDKGIRSGAGEAVGFYGLGGNARKLAYLVDASGSMISSMHYVVLELKRSISELSDKQTFTVIFFQEDDVIEVPVPNPGMKRATSTNKQKVIEWIDLDTGHIIPRGRSRPIPALKLALRYQPQLLFLLSDDITGQGKFEEDQNRLLAEIKQANVKNTKINTIQFLYEDKLAMAIGLDGQRMGEEGRTLFKISEQTGGLHKFLDAKELGIQ